MTLNNWMVAYLSGFIGCVIAGILIKRGKSRDEDDALSDALAILTLSLLWPLTLLVVAVTSCLIKRKTKGPTP